MGQSLVEIYVHIVFSTKHRQPFLTDIEFRAKTHAYMSGILRNSDVRRLWLAVSRTMCICSVAWASRYDFRSAA